jgi:hypothetical protein
MTGDAPLSGSLTAAAQPHEARQREREKCPHMAAMSGTN